MMKRLALCAAALGSASAFAPMGGTALRPASLRAPAAAGLKMQATEDKVTLGLAESVLSGNEQAKEIFGFLQSQTFSEEGDFLDLLAAHPIQALLYSGIILYASLPPLFEAREDDCRSIAVFRAAVPGEYREKIMDLYNKSGLDKIFTEEAELTNSRAAMAAMGVFIVTASLFT